MRININLATNPYEAAREFRRRMGLLVAALAVLAVGLLGYIVHQRSQTRDVDQKIAAAKQEIASLDAEKAQAQAILNQPQNREVADQSQFLNQLFARKALSWTRVFTEMERLMPANIHVVSMKPEFDRENQLVLHVVVTTSARDKAVELVKQMEKSRHFRSPQVEAENTTGNEGNAGAAGSNIQFEIAAVYVPFAEDSDAESGGDHKEKQEAEEKDGVKPTAPNSGKAATTRKAVPVQKPAPVRKPGSGAKPVPSAGGAR
jgi:type IV pilus assembly protein PilN